MEEKFRRAGTDEEVYLQYCDNITVNAHIAKNKMKNILVFLTFVRMRRKIESGKDVFWKWKDEIHLPWRDNRLCFEDDGTGTIF